MVFDRKISLHDVPSSSEHSHDRRDNCQPSLSSLIHSFSAPCQSKDRPPKRGQSSQHRRPLASRYNDSFSHLLPHRLNAGAFATPRPAPRRSACTIANPLLAHRRGSAKQTTPNYPVLEQPGSCKGKSTPGALIRTPPVISRHPDATRGEERRGEERRGEEGEEEQKNETVVSTRQDARAPKSESEKEERHKRERKKAQH